ncbi:MAG: adenosylhomocysteinase [Candidatus Omnitrophica bacterium]|nr:adenosylhomocysteinase [Candidatus Omnitrophota bacterium]
MKKSDYDVKNLALAASGKKRIEWARRQMPVIQSIEKRFLKQKPLKGYSVAACLHVTTETANLMIALKSGGADVALCASNPLSTQDETAASLVKDYGIPVFAIHAEDRKTYYRHIHAVLDRKPRITMDDGADLVSVLHTTRRGDAERVIGGTEETTTGVIRLRALEKEGKLLFPMIAVNDAYTKHFFDNRYGTGQSTFDGILRGTNMLVAGSTVVIAGYGWCGRGVAVRARGMGARVIVTEVDPLKGIEAVMDGFDVMPMQRAAAMGDLFITVTGDINVLRKEHFLKMKDGAIIANSGHFDVEIDVKSLKRMASKTREIRPFLNEYTLAGGRKIYLLAEGRLVNLSSAEGHPAMVMDMSFANQALSCEYMRTHASRLKKCVIKVPDEIDSGIAKLKLSTMGIRIDTLTAEQKHYLTSWNVGT